MKNKKGNTTKSAKTEKTQTTKEVKVKTVKEVKPFDAQVKETVKDASNIQVLSYWDKDNKYPKVVAFNSNTKPHLCKSSTRGQLIKNSTKYKTFEKAIKKVEKKVEKKGS